MHMFEINGEEHELKLTLESVKYLNGLHQGGGFALIQKAISGDIETFISVVYAGLLHTKKGFKRADVEKAIDAGISEERIDFEYINKITYGVIAESFFYKKTVERIFATDPKAKKEIEKLMK